MNDLPDPGVARAVAVPLRRQILDIVVASDHPVTVAELTDALGCNHNAVRQHLAHLRRAGLVTEGRDARGVPGRPRLLYTPAVRPNPYERLARLLLAARGNRLSPREAGRRAGRSATTAIDAADAFDAVERDAAEHGFAPRRMGRGRTLGLVLESCPLAEVAADDAATVCALHRGLVEGITDAVGGARVETFVAEDPYEAGCRIGIRHTS